MTRKRKPTGKAAATLTTAASSPIMREALQTWHGIQAAMQRVGTDPEAQFSWLQDLARLDIRSAADEAALHFEMNAFHLQRTTARAGEGLEQPIREMRSGELFEPLPIRRSDVPVLLRLVKECFDSLRTKAHWELPPVRLGLQWNKPTNGQTGMVLTTVLGDGKAVFLVELRALLTDVRYQLRECAAPGALSAGTARCERLFLAGRVTQVYCSRTCQNRATQAQWRQEHAQDLAKKRRKRIEMRRREQRAAAAGIHVDKVGRIRKGQPT